MSDNRETIQMICMGERALDIMDATKLGQTWLDPDGGEERVWSKPLVKLASPGAIYEFTVTREDGRLSVFSSPPPQFIEREKSDRVTAWVAEEREAQNKAQQRRYEARMNKEDPLRELVLPMRQFLHRMRNKPHSQYALIAAITAELHRPLTKAEQEEMR